MARKKSPPAKKNPPTAKPSDLQKLIARGQKTWAPFTARFAKAAPAAVRAWEGELAALVKQREARRREAAECEAKGMSPILRNLTADERYRSGLEQFSRGLDVLTVKSDPASVLGSVLVQDSGLVTLDGPRLILDLIVAMEETIDVFGPPYAGQGTELQGGPHQQQQAVANRTTGSFRIVHTIGHEGGFSYAAAAIWTHFMRKSPGSPPGQGKTGLAQVRPYVPFDYGWQHKSYVAPAHGHGGFGVFVASEDLAGGDRRTEQNHQYWIFADGTSWYQTHHNPAFSSLDHDHALTFGDQAPWFVIHPGRIYSTAVWCFGECDAHGATIEQASYAQAAIVARMPFLVIAQTKN
jgi:hypothetical protein